MLNVAWSSFVIRLFAQIVFVISIYIMIQMSLPSSATLMAMPPNDTFLKYIEAAIKS